MPRKIRNWKEEKVYCQMCLNLITHKEGSRYMSNLYICHECYQEVKAEKNATFTRAYKHDKKHKDMFVEVVPILSQSELKQLLDSYRQNNMP